MSKPDVFCCTFFLVFLTGCQTFSKPLTPLTLDGVERIVFLGNSITYAGQYIDYIESFLRTNDNAIDIQFINLGLPSETVSGLSEKEHMKWEFPRPNLHHRLDRVLKSLNPDLVFACYGMNDGIYKPFHQERFKAFKNGINTLHRQVGASGAKIIYLTPPIYDKRFGAEYAEVLDVYSNWLLEKGEVSQWQVVDIHYPMKKELKDRRKTNDRYSFAQDGIHPNEEGHWIMAREVLAYLGHKEARLIKNAEMAFSTEQDKAVLRLVQERQKVLKDAWLTKIGHKRPQMDKGLPLADAEKIVDSLTTEIDSYFIR